MSSLIKIIGLCVVIFSSHLVCAEDFNPLQHFKESSHWTRSDAVSAVGKNLQFTETHDQGDIVVIKNWQDAPHLIGNIRFGDMLLSMEFLVPENSSAKLFLQGRYALQLANKNNEWQQLHIAYRAPRFDEARNKTENALIMQVRINGEIVSSNQIMAAISDGATMNWESNTGPITLQANGPFAFRRLAVGQVDFSKIKLPKKSGEATNEKSLVDFVKLGKDTFESVGCNACHLTEKNNAGVSTGPNLYGLFKREPRNRTVVEGGEGHQFIIKANRQYLHRSIREPASQIAIKESGDKTGEAFLPIMPAFSKETLSDTQIDAIADYLATLNEPHEQGPLVKLQEVSGEKAYDPIADRLQLLINDQVRIQRGPMLGVSGRAIHVGTPWGIHYSFDPRLLAITKIWQGGFLDMSGEFLNRGGGGLKMGYESREVNTGSKEYLLAPLNENGEAIDFSFKEAKFGDVETIKKSLYSSEDHLQKLKAINARFKGYSRDSQNKNALPVFRYSVGKNEISIQTSILNNGQVNIELEGKLAKPQGFAVNSDLLKSIQVTQGKIENDQWILPKGKIKAGLAASMTLAENSWRSPYSTFNYQQQRLEIKQSTANMPAGYSIESYYPPKDNYGRDQLFEALGLAQADDDTLIIGTRTAGIWRIENGEWKLFAEGTFDSLGLLLEDKKGWVVIAGQKAELTRISDTNGDGLADNYETLFDAHSYHGNYHSYMHGPVRGADGAYYFNINLADGNDGSTYKAGGAYMGSAGGFAGWAIRVEPDTKFSLWANGLRSPASIGVGPDKKIWYADNQGEYMGTSKLFVIEKNKFYGHPSALVDLPRMTPDSKEILWDKVKNTREDAVVLLPHNRLANSPGNPAWDTTQGKFGPFKDQILMGDQTQSNLFRITTEKVNKHMQGAVIPFIDGLESGVMRPLFLRDGSLLLGQTGRGWQAKGGHVASLQKIKWDGKTVTPAILNMKATATGFNVEFTRAIAKEISTEELQQAIKLESWVYRDAPDYGSDELGLKVEKIKSISISEDAKHIRINLDSLIQPDVHPDQTARMYHLQIQSKKWFNDLAPETLQAYYTLYEFAKK